MNKKSFLIDFISFGMHIHWGKTLDPFETSITAHIYIYIYVCVCVCILALIAEMVRAFDMNPKVGGSSPPQVETFSVSKTLTLS